jgi:hypothetical protein
MLEQNAGGLAPLVFYNNMREEAELYPSIITEDAYSGNLAGALMGEHILGPIQRADASVKFVFDCWVRFSVLREDKTSFLEVDFFGKPPSTSASYAMLTHSAYVYASGTGEIGAGLAPDSASALLTATVGMNTWQRITLEEKESTIHFYVNHYEVSSFAGPAFFADNVVVRAGSTGTVKIYGSVDELLVFNDVTDMDSVWCHNTTVAALLPPSCEGGCAAMQHCAGNLGDEGTCFCIQGYALINGACAVCPAGAYCPGWEPLSQLLGDPEAIVKGYDRNFVECTPESYVATESSGITKATSTQGATTMADCVCSNGVKQQNAGDVHVWCE